MKRLLFTFLGLTLIAMAAQTTEQLQAPEKSLAAHEIPAAFANIGIKEKLGDNIDLSLPVQNERGETVTFGSFFKGDRPVIFTLVYFNCPGLCNLHLNGLFEGMVELDWSAGQKFDVVVLSFDSKEGSDLAAKKKQTYMNLYERPGTEGGIHFITASEEVVQAISGQVGFSFRWDEAKKEWAHASAAIMLTPSGRIARYLHGITFDRASLKLALGEAGEGKIGTFIDKMVWYCFAYDPQTSQYTLVAFRLVQLGGGLMVLLMSLFLIPTWLRLRAQSAHLGKG